MTKPEVFQEWVLIARSNNFIKKKNKENKFKFVMQHVYLIVDNIFRKFHEIMIKNKKVLGPYRVNINGLLATGSVGTGS